MSGSAWWDPEGLFLHPEQRPGFLSLWEILEFTVGLGSRKMGVLPLVLLVSDDWSWFCNGLHEALQVVLLNPSGRDLHPCFAHCC